MESTRSKPHVLLQKELPFGENILVQHLGSPYDQRDHDSLISRQEFLRLLEIKVNR